MDNLREELFAEVENSEVTIGIENKYCSGLFTMNRVYVGSDEEFGSNGDWLKIEWEYAEIEKKENSYIIKLPDMTVSIILLDKIMADDL